MNKIEFIDFQHALDIMTACIELEQAGDKTAIEYPVYHAAVHHVFTHMHTEAPELARMFDEGFRRFFPELTASPLVDENGNRCFTIGQVAEALEMTEEEVIEQMRELQIEPVPPDTLHKLQ